ncbi:MAG TPA: hypothetical protein VNC12_04585, partial [Solirubrobacteraceae bacterium]|nr:hypothetical protein [Solirubrobacteraceae bacterium]
REVEMTLYLRDVLLEYAAQRVAAGAPAGPNDHYFGGVTGLRRSVPRVRSGVLELSVRRANQQRHKAALADLPAITPHSLRRTWATFAALAGRDQNWIADQIGHTTPHFTFSVYEQVHRRRYVDEQAIWELMRFADEPAASLLAPSHARLRPVVKDNHWDNGRENGLDRPAGCDCR